MITDLGQTVITAFLPAAILAQRIAYWTIQRDTAVTVDGREYAQEMIDAYQGELDGRDNGPYCAACATDIQDATDRLAIRRDIAEGRCRRCDAQLGGRRTAWDIAPDDGPTETDDDRADVAGLHAEWADIYRRDADADASAAASWDEVAEDDDDEAGAWLPAWAA